MQSPKRIQCENLWLARNSGPTCPNLKKVCVYNADPFACAHIMGLGASWKVLIRFQKSLRTLCFVMVEKFLFLDHLNSISYAICKVDTMWQPLTDTKFWTHLSEFKKVWVYNVNTFACSHVIGEKLSCDL